MPGNISQTDSTVSFADVADPYDLDYDYAGYDDGDDYDEVLYQAYPFERTIYLYIWVILVIATCLLNVVVVIVLTHKKMRNPTFMILVAISVSDSLTGIVTLPTYIDVFSRYLPSGSGSNYGSSNVSEVVSNYSDYDGDHAVAQAGMLNKATVSRADVHTDGTFISNELCDAFMLSKFFLSKTFHTASVWLTLFLGMLRFLTVYNPLSGLARSITMNKTVILCVSMFVLAPFLHVYHLFKDKSVGTYCKWQLYETGGECGPDCLYLWIALLLSHLLPAVFLIGFTVIFVYKLNNSLHTLRNIGSSRQNNSVGTAYVNRERENRRVSKTVTAIVIVFLVAEVPYSGFLLYNVTSAHAHLNTNLHFNRAIHAAYEILLVLSFNANFYIYTYFNKRFRNVLREIVIIPVYNATCARMCSRFRKYVGKPRSRGTSGTDVTVEMTSLKTVASESAIVKQCNTGES